MYISTAGTSVCFWGWLREEICSHSVELVLYNALESPALHSPTWFSPNKVHVFVVLSPHIASWFGVFTLALKLHLLIDALKTTRGDPWSSPLLDCWGLVTDLKGHLVLLKEIAISPVLVHLLSSVRGILLQLSLARLAVAEGCDTEPRQQTGAGWSVLCVQSAFAVYMCIYEIHVYL